MAILVGIDEAGYGPLLGPLVVSSAAFEVPDELLKADMWGLLADSVGKKRAKLAGRLLINDSKKAYSKAIGITHLQRTTLAMLAAIEKAKTWPRYASGHATPSSENHGQDAHATKDGCATVPQTIGELLWALCPQCLSRLGGYVWYQRLDLCKLDADMADVGVAADVFGRNLAAQKMRPLVDEKFLS